ncbi:MAG: hypothetical protein MJ158_00415 [Alphaproteobacteria bacterium]|nr:hypothetical protein [Alphaproteobacteria bacterium]
MKKATILIPLLSIIPTMCMANTYDDRIADLTRKKQAKMEELDKCAGVKKSLKIAGISTLGITAVGVAGNIAEAVVLKKKNTEIDTLQKEIDTTNENINQKRLEIAEKERLAQQQVQQQAQVVVTNKIEAKKLSQIVTEDIANITSKTTVNLGDYIVTHGYSPDNLPDDLRGSFSAAAKNWIQLCRNNIAGDVAEVTAKLDDANIVKQVSNLTGDSVLTTTTPIQYVSCLVESCKNDKVPNSTKTGCVVDGVKDFASLCTAQGGTPVMQNTNGKCSFGSGKSQAEITQKCNTITASGVTTYVKQIGSEFVCVTNLDVVWDGTEFKQNMDICTCDNNSGGAYCSLDDVTRTKCMIRACKDSNKVPDAKGEKCIDKTDANLITMQRDGQGTIATTDIVVTEGQDCGANEYIPDNVLSAKKVKNSKGGLTCQLTCSGNMVGVLDYDLEKYKCVADSTNSKIDLSKLTFKQKCEALTGGENGYDGGYFTENGTEYCTPYAWDDESIVTKLCNDLGATKCRAGKETTNWTCTTGNTCSMFNNTYPDIPSDTFALQFRLPLPDCSQAQLDSLSADDGVYRNGSCEAISCKNGLPFNDDGTCSLKQEHIVEHNVGGDPQIVAICTKAGGSWDIERDWCNCPDGYNWNEDERPGVEIGCYQTSPIENKKPSVLDL